MSPVPTMPNPGLGTFRLEGDTVKQMIHTALKLGYRHIDTAQFYGNEADIGAAIAESDVPREEIFVTTKVWHDRLRPDDLKASVEESLARLRMMQVDLLLIHWPSPDDAVPMEDYLLALSDVQKDGKTRHIGVSNFTRAQIDQALDILGPDTLLTNQIEVHPFLQNRNLVAHCQSHDIAVSAFMPLAVGKVMEDPTLQEIATAHDATPAQIAIAWLNQLGIVTFPSSTREANLKRNIEALDITLSDREMAEIATLDRGERIANPSIAPDWDQ
ncbi:2,5-didehydrogluconate reductase DkgB [Halomonas sp. 18H]|uniref:2,5-didehydrogluconate reductase DkgB n=1 Tax=Halomonas almeriensis TaxID=308163 RepID=UPI0022314B38|nr:MULTISPECIES: 2,5-didehydrogluconate reductase DkgB [Halomonas]MCW4149796.1 2,5-didehydrogluconate reductase DkgB [Halomonas sp. 18H]MDN3553243.1 2,5-didehydrogluconate reductase DkgB [Halomonas almeriensis]